MKIPPQQPPFAEGGEATLYEYGQTHLVKIFKTHHVDPKVKEKKIKSLINTLYLLPEENRKVIALPDEMMYDNNKFIGYSMEKIDGEEVKRLSNKKHVKTNQITYSDILKVLTEILTTLNCLHVIGVYVGDLNDSNILYDKDFNVHFIDCDSWSIDRYPCLVAMDSFKDPRLKGVAFDQHTDIFAYAVLLFKTLTKIHPYGGTTNPDMDILERMKRGVSVVNNSNIKIPKTIRSWNYIPPKLVDVLDRIFSHTSRSLPFDLVNDFYQNLVECPVDKEYYYKKFNGCPFCDAAAVVVIEKPQKLESVDNLVPVLYFSKDDVRIILSEDSYINTGNQVIHRNRYEPVKFEKGVKYYFSNDGKILYEDRGDSVDIYHSNWKTGVSIVKQHRSLVNVLDNKLYFLDRGGNLTVIGVEEMGNSKMAITKCAHNSIFRIHDMSQKHYFVCNIYDNVKIINVSGINYELREKFDINNYGIHFDEAKKIWLFVVQDTKGGFHTYIFDRKNYDLLVYSNNELSYSSDLGNICISNGVIFSPKDGAIRGFAFSKNLYRDFSCSAVDEDSQLIKRGKRFTIINEKEVYTFG